MRDLGLWLRTLLKQVDGVLGLRVTYRMLRARYTDNRARYWSRQAETDIRKTWESRKASNSHYLSTALRGIEFGSLLELGSSCGNRLAVIAADRPSSRFVGIDINRLAVQCGKRWMLEEGINNVALEWGRVEDLSACGDGSFDVVFSWAVLMYVRPARILGVLKEALRVSAKAIVLIEMQAENIEGDPRGVYYPPGNWKRDYLSLLKEAGADSSRIECEWIPPDVWKPGGGGGACIRYIKDFS